MREKLTEIVKQAGKLSLKYFRNLNSENIDFKGEVDLVTCADKEVEAFLREELGKAFPEASFYGEESINTNEMRNGLCFVVDPIDGTTNFIHGHPFYAVSVGLQENRKTIAGAVYVPAMDWMYYAERGKGAWKGDTRLNVSNTNKLVNALVSTGFACVRQRLQPNNLPLFEAIVYASRGIRRCGSAAIDLCYVAEGIYDLYFEMNLCPWDIAAGTLIVEEAGGIFSDYNGGNDYEQKTFVACNPHLHEIFLQKARDI